jgi:copper oxidase (laccase) domain-containing protein
MSLHIEAAVKVKDGSPVVHKEVKYITSGIGVFPSFLRLPVRHGFTWGQNSENMAYKQHPQNVDPNIITQRNEEVLRILEMAPLEQAIVKEAYSNQEIKVITPQLLEDAQSTERGIFIPAHVVFTTVKQVPLIIKPGDCFAAFVYGLTRDEESLIGIMHSGRKELQKEVPVRAIEYLTNFFGCDPAELKIGLLPGLGVANHVIQAKDLETVIGETTIWDQYKYLIPNGDLHLDARGLFLRQLEQSGVNPENIEVYNIDTYQSAKQGDGFSQRYTNASSTRLGRFFAAIQLEK